MYKKADLFGLTDEVVMTTGELEHERSTSFWNGIAIATGFMIVADLIGLWYIFLK